MERGEGRRGSLTSGDDHRRRALQLALDAGIRWPIRKWALTVIDLCPRCPEHSQTNADRLVKPFLTERLNTADDAARLLDPVGLPGCGGGAAALLVDPPVMREQGLSRLKGRGVAWEQSP